MVFSQLSTKKCTESKLNDNVINILDFLSPKILLSLILSKKTSDLSYINLA